MGQQQKDLAKMLKQLMNTWALWLLKTVRLELIHSYVQHPKQKKAAIFQESQSIKITVYKAFSIYSRLHWVQLAKSVASPRSRL